MDVRDCVEVLDRLRDRTREKRFNVVNVGGTHVTSMTDLALTVLDVLGQESGIKRVSYEDAMGKGFDECLSRIPDLTKLDLLLPERSHTDFSKTIRDLAEAIKPNLEKTQCLSQTT